MNELFTHSAVMRVVWGIITLFMVGLWWLLYSLALESAADGAKIAVWIFAPFAWAYSLWGFTMIITSTGSVTLTDRAIMVNRCGRAKSITYEEIRGIRQGFIFLRITAAHDHLLIDRHIGDYHQLYKLLRQKIPERLPGPQIEPRKTQKAIPFKRFGPGSIHKFPWYFEGESKVKVTSIAEICAWLKGCRYQHDESLFVKRDFWQHPVTFEQIRKGDCEDHALWAWRKLLELGFAAEFVVGRAQWSAEASGAHAWVVYEENGRHYLLEATSKKKLIYPLEETGRRYKPRLGIDGAFKTYEYGR